MSSSPVRKHAERPLSLRRTSTGTEIKVLVIPRAGRTEVTGLRDNALLCRLAAAPVDGAANDVLVKLLSQVLHVRRQAVSIRAGMRARTKSVAVKGLTESDVWTRLKPIVGG